MSLREKFSKLVRRMTGRTEPGAVMATPDDTEQLVPIPGATVLMAAAMRDGDVFDVALARTPDIHATDSDGRSATMIAIRHSALDNATKLMRMGGVVDFGDPIIATQMTVASYEGNFDFLQALDARKTAQETSALMQQASEKTAAEKARQSKISEVVATVAGGADSVAAPTTARFRKKPVAVP